MRHLLPACAAGALLLSLTACATGTPMADDPTPSTSSRPPFATTTPGPVGPTGAAVGLPAERWDAVVADLAARGVSGTPELVSAETVTWPNGALGCPKPGTSYTQALVEGMRVLVRSGEATYDYRFGQGTAPLLCEN